MTDRFLLSQKQDVEPFPVVWIWILQHFMMEQTVLLVLWQEAEQSPKPDNILESTVDAAEWNLEVERVLPQLKVTVRTDNKVQTHRSPAWIWKVEVILFSERDAESDLAL